MFKVWLSGSALVLGIAAAKTLLVVHFALGEGMKTVATVSGLFAAFTILTAIVAYVAVIRLKIYLERRHLERLSPGGGETASKEEIIRRYAQEWGFSEAELDVAVFAAKGFSNVEIAEMRGSSVATIKTQLSHIFRKSGLENRYQLMAFVTDEVCVMAGRNDSASVKTTEVRSFKRDAVVPMVSKRKLTFAETFQKTRVSAG